VIDEFVRPVAVANEALAPVESRLQAQSERLLVWSWYWVDGTRTTSRYRAKLLQLRSQLQGRGDDAAVVVLYTPLDATPSAAVATLQSYAAAALPGITETLDDARTR
jgi:EpsI family protein